VEEGSVTTAMGHGLVGPKARAKGRMGNFWSPYAFRTPILAAEGVSGLIFSGIRTKADPWLVSNRG